MLRRSRLSGAGRPGPGTAPGTLVVPPESPAPAIRLITYDADVLRDREDCRVEDLAEALAEPDQICWIDVHGLGDPEILGEIAEGLGIHRLAMEDVAHIPQRPKAELYGDRLLFIAQMPRVGEAGHVEIEQVSFVLGPTWVASFRERAGGVFDPIRARLEANSTRIRRMGPDFLLYSLLDAVIDAYFPVIDELGVVLDALEDEVFEDAGRATFARIHEIRRTLLSLHRIQWRQRDALMTLLRDDELPMSAAVEPYLRDVHDHAFQTLDALETYREIVTGLMDLWMSLTSQRTNEIMKTLTIVATIFIPLTFITGVYGMNFEHMPELKPRLAYPLVWLAMIAIAVGLVGWFYRRGWIDSQGPPDPRDPPPR